MDFHGLITLELFFFLLPGTGKTTFIRMLAGGLKSDGGGEIHSKERTHTHKLALTHCFPCRRSSHPERQLQASDHQPQV